MCHGDKSVGAEVHHGGSGKERICEGDDEGKGQGDIHSEKAVPNVIEVRKEAQNYERGDICDKKRKADRQEQHLAGNEKPLPKGRGGCEKSISAQFEAPFRENLLQGRKGHCEACGRFGAFEHKHHEDIYDGNGV